MRECSTPAVLWQHAQSVLLGVSGAIATALLQRVVGALMPRSWDHLGTEIMVLTLFALPALGFLLGVLAPLRRRRSIVLRSLLANPAMYYCGGMIAVFVLPLSIPAPTPDVLPSLVRLGLMVCAATWVATLAGTWIGRLRTLAEEEPPGVCGGCGYDLTGNVSGRCPECGHPVARHS